MEATEQAAAMPAYRTGRNIAWISNRHLRRWLPLAIIVIVAFVVRVAALIYCGTGAIEQEGAEYARIAENLRHGLGYVGIATPGLQVNFPPLFPLLIAGASFVTGNYEWAGRLVALILGSLLPLPVFGIASRLFNRRVGFVAALLATLHPLLINLSFTVLSEGPYATCLLTAIYLTIRALDRTALKDWVLVGGVFGLSYLLRAEAVGEFAIALLFSAMSGSAKAIVKGRRVAAALIAFLLAASPEIVFLYQSTGKLRLEVKSSLFFYTVNRLLAAERAPTWSIRGQDVPSPGPNFESGQRWEEQWAWYGIDSQLRGTGTAMRPFVESVREARITRPDLIHLVKGIAHNGIVLIHNLNSTWFGAPFWPALAFLGAVRCPWRRKQATGRLLFMLMGVVPFVANPFALMPNERYSFIFVPLFCIWAANGLLAVGSWVYESVNSAGWRTWLRPTVVAYIVTGVLGLVMIIGPAKAVRTLEAFMEGAPPTRADEELGLWIGRQQSHPIRIMDLPIPLSYHAGAQYSHFPYCTSDLALDYLDAAKVDYIILRPGQHFTTYYAQWLEQGIPSSKAELLHAPTMGSNHFMIYRWHGDDDPSSRPLSSQARLQ